LFHLRTGIRHFLVVHQILVEVREVDFVEVDALQFRDRDPRQSGLSAAAKLHAQLVTTPLLLNDAGELAVKDAVNLAFLETYAGNLTIAAVTHTDGNLLGFRLADGHLIIVTGR
jgi:1-deoxy-D-xylulose 5-phosphate reductoisomerase